MAALDQLRDLGYTADEIGTLVINPRTLRHRRARQEPLTPDEADKAVRLARIHAMADEIFETRERTWRWLRTANRALDGLTPLTLLRTETGARAVEEALTQIDEGIFV